MSTHLRGSKRLQVIQNWLNGKDDEVWEVFPSRTEGKYIVRQRKEPLNKIKERNISEESDQDNDVTLRPEVDAKLSQNVQELNNEEQEQDDETVETPKPQKTKNKPKMKPKTKIYQQPPPATDPTVSLEILNQLKLLGDEIKAKREKKEQKRMIKEVVQKQMYRPHPQFMQPYETQYMQQPENTIKQPEIQQDVQQEIEQVYMPTRRRNYIFKDFC